MGETHQIIELLFLLAQLLKGILHDADENVHHHCQTCRSEQLMPSGLDNTEDEDEDVDDSVQPPEERVRVQQSLQGIVSTTTCCHGGTHLVRIHAVSN